MASTALALALAIVTSCIRSTPFQSEPSVTGITAKNLARLEKREAPRPFKLAAFGDTHMDYDNLRRTVRSINARGDVDLVLIAGDMTSLGLLEEFEWSHDVYEELAMPHLTVIGNHDALGHGPEIYREMYGPYDYAFTYGGIKFVMFNSNTLEFEGDAPNHDWLLEQVEDRGDAEGVILVTHQDLTNPDEYPGDANAKLYRDLALKDSVIGAVHGHNTDFDLSLWNGIPVLQCGTYEKVFLHTIVTVDGTKLSFEACLFDDCEPVAPVEEVSIE